MQPKIGIMNVTGRGAALDLCVSRAEDTMKKILGAWQDKMALIYKHEVLLSAEEMDETEKLFYEKEIDGVIVVVNAWFSSNILIRILRRMQKPLLVISIPYEDTNGITGASCFRGGLNEIGIPNTFLYGDVTDNNIQEEAFAFARAARVVSILKHSKYGFFGGQSLGMYTTMFDYAQVARDFGIDVTHEDQLQIAVTAEGIPENEVKAETEKLKSRFPIKKATQSHIDKSVRTYLALKRIVQERGYNFISVKCQPEMIDNYASCCLALSLLTDEGIPAACECDTNGALSMYILSLLSDEPSYFGDIARIDKKENMLYIANCGCAATRLAKNVVLHDQYDWMGKAQGLVTSFVCKKGAVTVLRIIRINGKYKMMMTDAEAVDDEKLLPTKEYWPHAFIRLNDCSSTDKFIKNVNSNHLHFTYGEYQKELEYVAKLLNVDTILY